MNEVPHRGPRGSGTISLVCLEPVVSQDTREREREPWFLGCIKVYIGHSSRRPLYAGVSWMDYTFQQLSGDCWNVRGWSDKTIVCSHKHAFTWTKHPNSANMLKSRHEISCTDSAMIQAEVSTDWTEERRDEESCLRVVWCSQTERAVFWRKHVMTPKCGWQVLMWDWTRSRHSSPDTF